MYKMFALQLTLNHIEFIHIKPPLNGECIHLVNQLIRPNIVNTLTLANL